MMLPIRRPTRSQTSNKNERVTSILGETSGTTNPGPELFDEGTRIAPGELPLSGNLQR